MENHTHDYNNLENKPSKLSEFENDRGFITENVLDNLTSHHVTTALGYTPVNKAGDTLNGSYTGNGKLFLTN